MQEIVERIGVTRSMLDSPFHDAHELSCHRAPEARRVLAGFVARSTRDRAHLRFDPRALQPQWTTRDRVPARATVRVEARICDEPSVNRIEIDIAHQLLAISARLDRFRSKSTTEQRSIPSTPAIEPAHVIVLNHAHCLRERA